MIFAGEDVVFSEREAFPVVGQQNSSQISVAVEKDAEKVEGFSLLPVGCRPEVGDCGEMGIVGSGCVDFYGEGVMEIEAPEVVEDAELFVGGVVDG